MQEIQQASEQGQSLYEVSDRSMNQDSISFGWILGTEDGRKLAWGKGPGYGKNTSHRAEGCWGKVAAAKFLFHLSRFTEKAYRSDTRLTSFADNKGLITSGQRRDTPVAGVVFPPPPTARVFFPQTARAVNKPGLQSPFMYAGFRAATSKPVYMGFGAQHPTTNNGVGGRTAPHPTRSASANQKRFQ
jgi:hypothetical protein